MARTLQAAGEFPRFSSTANRGSWLDTATGNYVDGPERGDTIVVRPDHTLILNDNFDLRQIQIKGEPGAIIIEPGVTVHAECVTISENHGVLYAYGGVHVLYNAGQIYVYGHNCRIDKNTRKAQIHLCERTSIRVDDALIMPKFK
jgi:hypothetical protein